MRWWKQEANGLLQQASDALGRPQYMPLYNLKQIRKKKFLLRMRDSATPELEGDNLYL